MKNKEADTELESRLLEILVHPCRIEDIRRELPNAGKKPLCKHAMPSGGKMAAIFCQRRLPKVRIRKRRAIPVCQHTVKRRQRLYDSRAPNITSRRRRREQQQPAAGRLPPRDGEQADRFPNPHDR